jgi:hypothetical protein
VSKLKKQYEPPIVEIEEFEIENLLGNLCSGGIGLITGVPIFEYEPIIY